MRRIGRLLLAIVGLLITITVLAFGYDRYASPQVLENYPAQGEILTVNGLDTHVICQGEGEETVILFHGFAGGAIDMIPLMDALDESMRVCSFDRPGNDYASPMPDNWTLSDSLAWHNALIRELTDSTPYIAGHSLGGAYALAHSAEYPVQGIISLDGLSPEIADEVVGRMGTYSSLSLVAEAGLLRPIAGSFVSPDYDADLSEQMNALRSRSQNIIGFAEEGSLVSEGLTTEALSDAVTNLDVPVLIFGAEQTDVPEGQAFLESLIILDNNYPQSTLIPVPDARHYLIATHTDFLAETILEWINSQ